MCGEILTICAMKAATTKAVVDEAALSLQVPGPTECWGSHRIEKQFHQNLSDPCAV